MENATVPPKLHRQAAVPKDSKHRLVLREHIGLEVRHASVLSDAHQMPQDVRRDAEPR